MSMTGNPLIERADKPAEPRTLMCDGVWLVPVAQRPSGWEQYRLPEPSSDKKPAVDIFMQVYWQRKREQQSQHPDVQHKANVRHKVERKSPQSWKRGIQHTRQCGYCHKEFRFLSTVRPDGSFTHPRHFCSRSCIANHRWENRRKMPGKELLVELYIVQQMSQPSIAKQLGTSASQVSHWLHKYGVPTRIHTSRATCKVCGDPVEKRLHTRKNKQGQRIMSGALCIKHRRKYFADWVRNRKRKSDPLIGTRKTGVPGFPTECPKCGKRWDSQNFAMKCCHSTIQQVRKRRLTQAA